MAMLPGVQSLTLASPTGSGKSVMMSALINLFSEGNKKSLLLTNRIMLTRQTSDNLEKHGIAHGVRAASMPEKFDSEQLVQVSSMQTEISRKGLWAEFPADYVLVDEAHQQVEGESLDMIMRYIANGAKVVLATATPIGLSHVTPNLIVGALNSELRKCGAHVPAIVNGIKEFDTSRIKRKKVGADTGEFSLDSIRKEFWCQAIVGIVYQEWVRLNPLGRMTLGFAPGAQEATSLAHEFWKFGTKAASISANGLWANGKDYRDDSAGKNRKAIVDEWNAGDIKILWNRYVFREGIDYPNIFHLILATPIGSYRGYIQTVGRVIRKSPLTPDYVLMTDHAGNWHRHGSPNDDIDWRSLYFLSEGDIREKNEAKQRKQLEEGTEPACCGSCGVVLKFGKCPQPPIGCGKELSATNPNKLRHVIQQSGEIVKLEGSEMLPKKKKPSSDSIEQKRWNQIFWAARNSQSQNGMTFKQAFAMYRRKYDESPPRGLKFTPSNQADMDRRIRHVEFRDLICAARASV